MAFGHEKLDVYRAAIEYVGWAYRFCEALVGHRNAKDQLLRASQAIPLNIAEGNGKGTEGDRRRYFEIARGSALECGAAQDVLQVCRAMTAEENAKAKALLDRIVAMLTKLGQRGYAVHEEAEEYRMCCRPSCGFQFGYDDDDRGITFEVWRRDWIKRGMPWSSKGISCIADWNPETQLRNLR